jgi:hypothetical protein
MMPYTLVYAIFKEVRPSSAGGQQRAMRYGEGGVNGNLGLFFENVTDASRAATACSEPISRGQALECACDAER